VTFNVLELPTLKADLMKKAPSVVRRMAAGRKKGADPLSEDIVRLITSEYVKGASGCVFRGEKEIEPSGYARDEENQRRLWEESSRLSGLGG
jgi:hypothetical protein